MRTLTTKVVSVALIIGLLLPIAAAQGKADKGKANAVTSATVPDEATKKSAEKAAVKAADEWLALVDEGKYAESWKAAAEYFRNVISRKQWVKSLTGARAPLGKLVSRKIKSKTYTTTLPGAPDGQYVVIQYDTSFANKTKALETVTPMREKDGTWRVSGYYIR